MSEKFTEKFGKAWDKYHGKNKKFVGDGSEWVFELTKSFDESKHPRLPKGKEGGEFTSNGAPKEDGGFKEEPEQLKLPIEEEKWGNPLEEKVVDDSHLDKVLDSDKYYTKYISMYAASEYYNINNYLRHPDKYDSETKEYMNNILLENMDDIIRQEHLPEQTEVYRGMAIPESDPQWGEVLKDPSKSIGKVMSMPAYCSTSLEPDTALNFSEPARGGQIGVVCQIRVPRGYNGAYLNTVEKEVLLPRNTKFRIRQAYYLKDLGTRNNSVSKSDDTIVLNMEVVPNA